MYDINPIILELFHAPYGTDLCWLYDNDIHTGFYDLKLEKEFSIVEMINMMIDIVMADRMNICRISRHFMSR